MFKRNGIWWICIRDRGRKIQKSLKTTSRKLAQKIEAKIRISIVEGEYFEKSVGEHKTFKEMMDKFMEEHAPKVSVNMQSSYATSLKHTISFFGNLPLMSISPKDISRFKVKRRGENAAAGSINRELSMISKAFNLAIREWEWLKENPVSRVPREKENNERDRWLTADEERRLLANSPVWLRDITVFATNTGLRQSELLSLEWPQVELERKVILLRHTKNGKPRTIPLNQNATNVLMRKAGEKVRSLKSNVVFASGSGAMINRYTFMRAFAVAVKKAGLVGVTFHTCRHTFCTRLAQKGIDIYKISKLVGHEDVRMTQRYSHHCTESLREGVGILDSDYNLTTIGQI